MERAKRDKLLKDLICAVHCSSPEPDLSDPETLEALEYWAAKECVLLERTWGGAVVGVSVTPTGFTWFADRREACAAFWREHLVNFVGGFISGVLTTIIAAWIIQALL